MSETQMSLLILAVCWIVYVKESYETNRWDCDSIAGRQIDALFVRIVCTAEGK